MFDPGAINNLGVGGALLTALWLVLKYKPWKNGHGSKSGSGRSSSQAGELDPAEWDRRIQAIVQKETEALMADIRQLMEGRNIVQREKLLDPIINEIIKTRHDLRNVVSEAIAKAYLESRGKMKP